MYSKFSKTVFSKTKLKKLDVKGKKNEPFNLTNPHFTNPESKQKVKISFAKRWNDVKNTNHWLESKAKQYQSGKYSKEKIKIAYECYLNDSLNGSSSSLESNPSVKKWNEIPKKKVEGQRTVDGNGNSMLNLFHWMITFKYLNL